MSCIEGDRDRVKWMPAHNGSGSIAHKRLSDGTRLTREHVAGNDLVDCLAKEVAKADARPKAQMAFARAQARRVVEAAQWLGRCTAYANHCPLSDLTEVDPHAKRQYVRDTTAAKVRRLSGKALAQRPSAPVASRVTLAPTTDASRSDPSGRATTTPKRRHTLAQAADASARAKRVRANSHREDAVERHQLQRWRSSRPQGHEPAMSAAERVPAIKARLERKRACPEPVDAPT